MGGHRFASLLAVIALLAACSESITIPTAPYIELTALPTSIQLGELSTLHWTATGNISTLSISQGVGNVNGQSSVVVQPSDTTTYTLTAVGPGGIASTSVVVQVLPTTTPPAPAISSFISTPEAINTGGTATLAWSLSGDVTAVSIHPNVGNVSGLSSFVVQPFESTEYLLTATGPGGVAHKVVTVKVETEVESVPPTPPSIEAFAATPDAIPSGGTATLSWVAHGDIDSLLVEPEVGDVTGLTSVVVSPSEATTYTLTAYGAGIVDTATVAVELVEAPTAHLLPTPNVAGSIPLSVSFGAADSFDPEGGPLTYYWDFGDGAASLGETVEHIYTNAGEYITTLTVVSPSGLSDSATTIVTAYGTVEITALLMHCSPSQNPQAVVVDYSSSREAGQFVGLDGKVELRPGFLPGEWFSVSARGTCAGVGGSVGLGVRKDGRDLFTGFAYGGDTVSYVGTY